MNIFSLPRLAILLLLVLCCSIAVAEDLQPIPKYAHLIDQTQTLSGKDFSLIQQKLVAYESEKGTQVAVLIVHTARPEATEQYANRISNDWKLGRAGVGDGVILLLALDDHESRIEVARALEPVLTDIEAHRILHEYAGPKFANHDIAGGIEITLDLIFKSLALEPLPAPRATKEPPSIVGAIVAVVFGFLIFLVSASASYSAGRGLGVFATFIISVIAGVLTRMLFVVSMFDYWIPIIAGVVVASGLAFCSYKLGMKMMRLFSTNTISTSSKSKSSTNSNYSDITPSMSNKYDSTSSSDSSSSDSSGGGGDFAGGGASDKW